jgi:hypothetical protein
VIRVICPTTELPGTGQDEEVGSLLDPEELVERSLARKPDQRRHEASINFSHTSSKVSSHLLTSSPANYQEALL